MTTKKPEARISAGATRTLNNLLVKADAYAFMGSMHPEEQLYVEEAYNRAVKSMRKLIHRLESNQIGRYAKAINK